MFYFNLFWLCGADKIKEGGCSMYLYSLLKYAQRVLFIKYKKSILRMG